MWLSSALMSVSQHHMSKKTPGCLPPNFYCCTGGPWEWGYKPSSSDLFMFSELVCTNWWSIILLVERKTRSWYPEFSYLRISMWLNSLVSIWPFPVRSPSKDCQLIPDPQHQVVLPRTMHSAVYWQIPERKVERNKLRPNNGCYKCLIVVSIELVRIVKITCQVGLIEHVCRQRILAQRCAVKW